MNKEQLVKPHSIKRGPARISFDILSYLLVGLIALLCLLPFIILLSGSFSSEQAIRFTGYGLFPKEFTLEAYQLVFKTPVTILRAYGVSFFITGGRNSGGLIRADAGGLCNQQKGF
jgi:putative aldouronate transport system permease protein